MTKNSNSIGLIQWLIFLLTFFNMHGEKYRGFKAKLYRCLEPEIWNYEIHFLKTWYRRLKPRFIASDEATIIFVWNEDTRGSRLRAQHLFAENFSFLAYIRIHIYTLEPLIAYTLMAYEGGASGRSRLVGGGFSL